MDEQLELIAALRAKGELLTTAEASQIYGYNNVYFTRLLAAGTIGGIRITRQLWLTSRTEIERYRAKEYVTCPICSRSIRRRNIVGHMDKEREP